MLLPRDAARVDMRAPAAHAYDTPLDAATKRALLKSSAMQQLCQRYIYARDIAPCCRERAYLMLRRFAAAARYVARACCCRV